MPEKRILLVEDEATEVDPDRETAGAVF